MPGEYTIATGFVDVRRLACRVPLTQQATFASGERGGAPAVAFLDARCDQGQLAITVAGGDGLTDDKLFAGDVVRGMRSAILEVSAAGDPDIDALSREVAREIRDAYTMFSHARMHQVCGRLLDAGSGAAGSSS